MSDQEKTKPVTVEDAIAKTNILKDVEMMVGTEGYKNFFVIHYGTMIKVGMKLTAEYLLTPRMVLRVRIVKQDDTISDLVKIYHNRLQKKFDDAKVEHAKVDEDRLSFIISSGISIEGLPDVFEIEVKDMVEALLEKTVAILNTVFGMEITKKSFKPMLTEICAVGLPKGVEDLTGLKTEGAKKLEEAKSKKATVTEIGKKEK